MRRENVLQYFHQHEEETRERIEYGIQRYRKGTFSIRLVDAAGNPCVGVHLELQQINHAFKHGADMFALDQLKDKTKNEQYKRFFIQCFNMAAVPFYWKDSESNPTETMCDIGDGQLSAAHCIQFCTQNRIDPCAYGLNCEQHFPDWSKRLPTQELKKSLVKRYQELSKRFGNDIQTVEVTNEMFHSGAEGDFSAFYNDDDYVEWCFEKAAQYFPDKELMINDRVAFGEIGRNRDPYYLLIERALYNRAKIDAVGLQYRVLSAPEQENLWAKFYYNPRYLYRILDLYSDFKRPLKITQVTIPAFSEQAEDEEIQAELIRYLYKIWFSHESVEQITYWNTVDGYTRDLDMKQNYKGGLFRRDLTPKPAYDVIRNLFEKEWHTQEKIVTDKNGRARFCGFFGDYKLKTAQGETHIFSASKDLSITWEGDREIVISLDADTEL